MGRRPLRTAALALALLPGVGSDDHRIPADPGLAPWSAVLRLQVAGVSRCTAVMVAPDLAATAAHCLWNKRLGHVVPVGSVHLLFGYDAGGFTRHAIPDAIRFPEGAEPSAPTPRGSDLALLHIDPPARDMLPPATAPILPGTPLLLGGFGQDRAQRLAIDPSCRALGVVTGPDGRPLLRHDCDGTRGTSGGAVVVQTADGWRLAGIQVGAEREGAGGVAVPAEAVARLIAAPR